MVGSNEMVYLELYTSGGTCITLIQLFLTVHLHTAVLLYLALFYVWKLTLLHIFLKSVDGCDTWRADRLLDYGLEAHPLQIRTDSVAGSMAVSECIQVRRSTATHRST